QWSIGMHTPVVKEIAKGSARIAIPGWMFTCLLFLACECIVIVASGFIGRASAFHHLLRVLAPSAKVGFAVAAILAILQVPLPHLPQKTLRQSAGWYCYLARLGSRREKSYLSRPAKA